jgi:type I restriction enzyme M protein
MVVTVMPHGVLFRGGVEKQIRTALLDEDMLEAVIGLAPNLFYGTPIAACILVLRSPGSKPIERRGKVIFINADREYHEGRAQNELRPENVERIANALDAFGSVPMFAQVVSRAEMRDNDDNLNIRRYADNTPAPEPQDVRAHLEGGVPRSEVDAKAALFAACGLNPAHVLVTAPRSADNYFDFMPHIKNRLQLGAVVAADAGVVARRAKLAEIVQEWWSGQIGAIEALTSGLQLMALRADLLASFQRAVQPFGVLDEFEVIGVIASWWSESQIDLKTIAARGFSGLVDAWATSIVTALEDNKRESIPVDHKLIRRLMPEYIEEVAALEIAKAELDAAVKAPGSDDEADSEEQMAGDALKRAKKERSLLSRQIKARQNEFIRRLDRARRDLNEETATALVLGILGMDLMRILDVYASRQFQHQVDAFDLWWGKYRRTLLEIESDGAQAASDLQKYLRNLGYV